MDGMTRREVAARFELRAGAAHVRVGRYDPKRPLVIDPVLAYSTFLGGQGNDVAYAIAVNAGGERVAHRLDQLDQFSAHGRGLPLVCRQHGRVRRADRRCGDAPGLRDVPGRQPGGQRHGIAVDSVDNAYVTGYTYSDNFPTTGGAFQKQLAPCHRARPAAARPTPSSPSSARTVRSPTARTSAAR